MKMSKKTLFAAILLVGLVLCACALSENTLTFSESKPAVNGGFPYTLQMQLSEPAAKDITVALTDDAGSAYTLIIPAGSKTGSTVIDTAVVTENTSRVITIRSAEGVSYKENAKCTLNVKGLPVVTFYSKLNIGKIDKQWRVQVCTNTPARVLPDNNLFELRDYDGRVLAQKNWKNTENDLVFSFDVTADLLGGHQLSVWLGDYCVSKESVFGTAYDPSRKLIKQPEVKDPYMSITVDCGWFNNHGEQILDVLDKYNVKATFFLTGSFIRSFPETVDRIVASGHEIGTHTNSHARQTELGEYNQMREIQIPCEMIYARYGIRPRLFRPPYGDYNGNTIAVSRGMGMEVCLWTIDSHDWDENFKKTPEKVIARINKNITPGTIILFHADGYHTWEILDQMIPYYQDELGLQCVPVGTMLESAGFELPPDPIGVYESKTE